MPPANRNRPAPVPSVVHYRTIARWVSSRALVTVGFAIGIGASSGCGTTSAVAEDGAVRNDVAEYKVKAPGAGWSEVRVGDADAAWVHETLHASIFVNAQCEGVDEAPLTALTNHLLFGTTEREYISQEAVMVSRREALETVVDFKLDGVPRRMKTLVMKKDGCVYDIVYAAPPKTFAQGESGYEALRSHFDVLPRKDKS